MASSYYTDLSSPETYEAFARSPRDISGFRLNQQPHAQRIRPGDKFVCYMTKLSRWFGVLEVQSTCFLDESPLFYGSDDPFVVRFKVKPIVWLPKDKAVPIHKPVVWDHLSFTKDSQSGSLGWTGILRRSLNRLSPEDGRYLEKLLLAQKDGSVIYPVNEDEYRGLVTSRIRRLDKEITVTVPKEDLKEEVTPQEKHEGIRESSSIQASIARVGELMGFRIWIPRNDRSSVLKEWQPKGQSLIDMLPLNYDITTLQTIEQIDVLWLRGRAISRAFEVEHTTAVYSGLLRMADLLALQPNMDIKLHIVAPEARKEKVFNEIRRPVFSLLEKAPLSECCTFISYDSLLKLQELPHLKHLSDSVLDEYAESAEESE
jgi:hypothetical protein